MNAFKKIRLWLGWCPNANMNRKITMQREIEIPEMDLYSKPPLFSPILLKDAYFMGITRFDLCGFSGNTEK